MYVNTNILSANLNQIQTKVDALTNLTRDDSTFSFERLDDVKLKKKIHDCGRKLDSFRVNLAKFESIRGSYHQATMYIWYLEKIDYMNYKDICAEAEPFDILSQLMSFDDCYDAWRDG